MEEFSDSDATMCLEIENKLVLSPKQTILDVSQICLKLQKKYHKLSKIINNGTYKYNNKIQIKIGKMLKLLRALKPQNYQESQLIQDLLVAIQEGLTRKSKRLPPQKFNRIFEKFYTDSPSVIPGTYDLQDKPMVVSNSDVIDSSIVIEPKVITPKNKTCKYKQISNDDDMEDFETDIPYSKIHSCRSKLPLHCAHQKVNEPTSQIKPTENSNNHKQMELMNTIPTTSINSLDFNSNSSKSDIAVKMHRAAILINTLHKQILEKLEERIDSLKAEKIAAGAQTNASLGTSTVFELTEEERLRHMAFLAECAYNYKRNMRQEPNSDSD